MHLDAIACYALENDLHVSKRLYGFNAIKDIVTSKDGVIFSQSTGLASLIVLPVARILGKSVVHYMHEPTPLRQKLRENPPFKILVWHAVQWVEAVSASKIMVSRQILLDQAVKVYRVSKKKVILAPLLMPAAAGPQDKVAPFRITYLGRIDERRYFGEFLKAAPDLAERGYKPTILTGDVDRLRAISDPIPPEIDVLAEANFSEGLKARILSETCVLWNPKHGSITQSGVTADAVRYGLSVLLTEKDPLYQSLREKGIAIDFYDARDNNFEMIDDIDHEAVAKAAEMDFSKSHGSDAFRLTYLPSLVKT